MIKKRIKNCFVLRSNDQLMPQPAVRLPMLPLVSALICFRRHPIWLVALAVTTDYHLSIDKEGLGIH